MLKTHLRKYLSTKDTEYAVGLPTDVRRIEFSTPSNADVQYSFTQGEVGTATFEGEVVFEREDTGDLRFVPDTLYLASNMPGTIMDLDIWHGD